MSDPLVSYDWCVRTGGALTAAQRRVLLARSIASYARHGVGLLGLVAGRRPRDPLHLPTVPDEDLVASALEVAAAQGPDVEGHGLRTWLFGELLAARDGVALDRELFCVAAIVHDAGSASVVPGEDFTIRSARLGVASFEHAGRALDDDRAAALRDGVVAHATAGVSPRESAIGAYVQAGALLDLAGIRLVDLPATTVEEAFERHPAGGVRATIQRVIEAEARAVPNGRFAQLHRLGLGLAVRTSPTLRRS